MMHCANVYKLAAGKVREFYGVRRNHKEKTEKRFWELRKPLNINETISPVVFTGLEIYGRKCAICDWLEDICSQKNNLGAHLLL